MAMFYERMHLMIFFGEVILFLEFLWIFTLNYQPILSFPEFPLP